MTVKRMMKRKESDPAADARAALRSARPAPSLRKLDTLAMLRDPAPAPPGVIYWAEAVGTPYVKIGWAKAPEPWQGSAWQAALDRLERLQTGCPFALRLVRIEEGSRVDEHHRHQEWAHARVRGEWFDIEALAS